MPRPAITATGTVAGTGATTAADRPRVAYVLKGWPRISELFIASEIWRLEQRGVPLRMFVIRPPDEDVRHPLVDRIRTTPTYLPPTTSLSGTGLVRWVAANIGRFADPLRSVARRHPLGLARALGRAAAQSIRARTGWRPKAVYAKELLLAVALADELDRAGDVGHLHAHFAHGCTTVAWLASTITGIPFSFTGHAKDIYRPSLNPAGLLARKLRDAEFTVTCTAANVEHLRAVEPAGRVRLAYHGLNAEFAELVGGDTPPPAERQDRVRIVSVGRLVPKKGFDVLVRATAELVERGLDVELALAGEDGPEAPAIDRLVTELGLVGRVVRLGRVTQAELLDEYRRSTLFALACRVDDTGDRDGIPNVLVEAMATGLPVVSTAVSGIPELIDGTNGLLVRPEDPSALAEAMATIASDPELAAAMGRRAAETVATRFDGDALAAELADLFAGSLVTR